MRMFTAFGIKVNLSEITHKNTGAFEKENLSLEEVKAKLDNLIKECGRFYYANSQNTTILKKYGKPTAEGMVESAMKHVQILEDLDFHDIVISLKSSNTLNP